MELFVHVRGHFLHNYYTWVESQAGGARRNQFVPPTLNSWYFSSVNAEVFFGGGGGSLETDTRVKIILWYWLSRTFTSPSVLNWKTNQKWPTKAVKWNLEVPRITDRFLWRTPGDPCLLSSVKERKSFEVNGRPSLSRHKNISDGRVYCEAVRISPRRPCTEGTVTPTPTEDQWSWASTVFDTPPAVETSSKPVILN